MELKFTPFPTLVRYKSLTDEGGHQKGILVTIDPKYRNDAGLHAHEYRHVSHFYICAIIAMLLVWFLIPEWDIRAIALPIAAFSYHILMMTFLTFRMWAEIDCYRIQIRTNGQQEHADLYASWFAKYYGIHKDPEWIKKQLLK